MEAKINDVFYLDADERVPLGETKAESPTLDGYRFAMTHNHISAEIEMSKDPSDGGYYSLLIGLFIDGIEAAYVTSWLRNEEDQRAIVYSLSVPDSPVKLNARTPKVHAVQFKIGKRRTVFGIPFPALLSRNYDLAESDVFYYKIGKLPE